MAVDTLPDGFPTIPILAIASGNELFAFLKDVFDAVLLDGLRWGAHRRVCCSPSNVK
jgi:hypothetical protein